MDLVLVNSVYSSSVVQTRVLCSLVDAEGKVLLPSVVTLRETCPELSLCGKVPGGFLCGRRCLFCFVLATPRGLQDLPTRDGTWAHGSESMES